MRIWQVVIGGVLIAGLLAVAGGASAAQMSRLKVVRDVLAARVENRQPVEATVPVAADIGELFYFTEVAGGPGTIRHVWIWQGRTMATVSLRVGASPGWKTWSSKYIMPQWTGQWRVEARDGDTVLSFKEFEVKR